MACVIQALRARVAHVLTGVLLACTTGLWAVPSHAGAPAADTRPVTLVVGFSAGAATDAAARLFAPVLGRHLGQTVVVENLGGASGMLAAKRVAQAPADGHTLLFGTVSEVVLAPVVNPATPYTPQDFFAVGKLASTSPVLVAQRNLPAGSIDELVALLKQQPNSLNLGHPGIGSLQHLMAATLARQAGVVWTEVPYKGAAPLLTDLLAGQVQLAVMSLPSAQPLLADGRIKSLGLMRAQRDPAHPALATINEGRTISGIDADLWLGLFAPVRVPPQVRRRLVEAVALTLRDPEIRRVQRERGADTPLRNDPAEFKLFLHREEARFRAIVARMNLN